MSSEDKEVVRDYEVSGVVEAESETTAPEPKIIESEITEEAPEADVSKTVSVTCTHLKNPENGRVFPVNKDLLKRKDLIPCNKDGKRVN